MADISDATRARVNLEWPAFLVRVADGELIRDALKACGITRQEQRAYLAGNNEARAQYQDAREQSADAFYDMAIDEAMSNHDREASAHARTRIDTLKWAARIRNPRLYGDKAQLDVNVRTVDLTAIIRDANARLVAQQSGRLIEHDASERPATLSGAESMLLSEML